MDCYDGVITNDGLRTLSMNRREGKRKMKFNTVREIRKLNGVMHQSEFYKSI